MIEFVKVSSLIKNLSLNITKGSSSTVNILQWQCEGDIEANIQSGVQITDEPFLDKAMGFLDLIIEKNPDLVLTPEYSFPYIAINKLLSEPNYWPKNGTLFCLGTQGENIHKFKQILDEWETNQNIVIIRDAISNLHEEKNFISPLIYLFVSNGNLYILPQIKTGNMSDKWRELEASHMCTGSKIFVFDDPLSTNKFLSVICADVLHIKANQILDKVPGNLTIFHPQLNGNPRHELFTSFRKEILDVNQTYNRIITLNWASNTKIKNSSILFNKPWSAFYKKHNKNLQGDFRKLRLQNLKMGKYFAYNGINEFWYSERNENIKFYTINKSDTGHGRGLASHGYEPITRSNYEYIDSWKPCSNNTFNSDVSNKLKTHGLEDLYLLPIDALIPEADKADFFFGSCFGHFEEGEIITNGDELVSRMILGSDEESDEHRDEKLDKFLLLINNLKKGNLPQSLSYLKDNHQFVVNPDFPDQGKMNYNLHPKKNVKFSNPEALVVITDITNKSKVRQLVSELIGKMSVRFRNQLIVYYRLPGKPDFVFFEEHLNDSEIQNPSYSKNMTDISAAK